MTTERVSLYGLPVSRAGACRSTGSTRPRARAMFLRHALVDGDWDGARHAFVQANQEQVADVVALEERVRRDLLVGDDDLVAFFDARVPDDVTSARRFDRWWKGAARTQPDLLTYTTGRPHRPRRRRPSTWPTSPSAWPLGRRPPAAHLRARPRRRTSTAWWSTCRCRCSTPSSGARLDWQVPGHRLDLVTALLRTLPKDAPAPPHAGRATWPPSVLASRRARRRPAPRRARGGPEPTRGGARWRAHHLDLAAVPDHLRVTYRAVDDGGRPLAWSKDLPALRRRLAERVREALAAAAPVAEVQRGDRLGVRHDPATRSR